MMRPLCGGINYDFCDDDGQPIYVAVWVKVM